MNVIEIVLYSFEGLIKWLIQDINFDLEKIIKLFKIHHVNIKIYYF